jgi:hypothetical protein
MADFAMITQQLLRLIQQLAFVLQTGAVHSAAAISPKPLSVSVDSLFYPFRHGNTHFWRNVSF